MPSKDIETEIQTTIWTGLNANPNWEVPVANQIRYDQVDGTADPEKPQPSDGDFPQARLWPVSGSSGLFTNAETFATYDTTGDYATPAPAIEVQSLIFRLETESDLLAISIPDMLRAEALTSFRNMGPRLGLPYVSSVRLRWTSRETEVSEDGSQRRWKSTIDVYIGVEAQISYLKGD